jgi:hypothetical protein
VESQRREIQGRDAFDGEIESDVAMESAAA